LLLSSDRALSLFGAVSYDALGLIAANNFGLADSARLLRTFLDALGRRAADADGATAPPWWTQLIDAAAVAATAAGVEVSPTPTATLDAIGASFGGNRVSFLCFDDDALDSTPGLARALDATTAVDVDFLPGGHLACVRIDALDFFGGIAAGTSAAGENNGGLAGASQEALDEIVARLAASFDRALTPPALPASR